MNTKDDNFWKILSAAITLDIQYGHQKWTVTKLAQMSKVSRPLIYHYFGKSKLGVLKEAALLIGAEFSGHTEQRMDLWKKGDFVQGLINSQNLLKKTPALIPFYFLNRQKENEIGKVIREQEEKFKKKLKLFFPHYSDTQIKAIFALIWGIVFSLELDEKETQSAVSMIFKNP